MTLVLMCQRVLAEVGWPVPSAIVSNNDATAQQIFAIANTELRSVSHTYDWPQLEVEYEFDTVADQTEYALPTDFRKIATDSLFDTEEYYRLRGSTPIAQWNKYKHGLLGSLSHQRYRMKYVQNVADMNPYMELTPAPTDIRSLVALYFTNELVLTNDGTGAHGYVSDDDASKVPEHVIELGVKWRFRRAKGLDFSAELAEYNTHVKQMFAGLKALGDIPVGGNPHYYEEGLTSGYVPDNGFGA